MKRLFDVHGAYELGRMAVMIVLIIMCITTALTLLGVISMLAFPISQESETFGKDLGSSLSQLLFDASNITVMFLAMRYFKDALNVGTPFTFPGADQVKRLAIVQMVGQGVALLGSYVIDWFFYPVPEDKLTNYVGLVLGVVLFLGSIIVRYGAELEEEVEKLKMKK